MNKIKNYEELVAHRRHLEANLRAQKGYLKAKVSHIKERFEPVQKVISFFQGDNKTKAKALLNGGSSLLKIGSSAGIDMLLQRRISKGGWFTKLVLPFVLRFAASKTMDKVQHKTA